MCTRETASETIRRATVEAEAMSQGLVVAVPILGSHHGALATAPATAAIASRK